jgi:Family of unknown function (DUF5519)
VSARFSIEMDSIAQRIQTEVASWPGVSVEAHRGGMIFFHVGRREIGHLHGNRLADLPFPVRIREQLVDSGKAHLHYLHPQTGWVSYYIRGYEDIAPIVELFRLNYARPWLERKLGA